MGDASPKDDTAGPPESGILVSVVIVNWKVRDLLLACLASLFEHTRLPVEALEVFVVDNASGDECIAAVQSRFPRVKCIDNRENVGFGRANNQAYRLCSGKYVLLLNPDTLILDDAIGRMAEIMERTKSIGILGPRLIYGDGSLQRWTAGRYPSVPSALYHYLGLNFLLGRLGPANSLYLNFDISRDFDVDWISGACLLLRRSAVARQLFDESYFMYGEDIELCHRIKGRGWRVVYSPSATVLHYHGRSIRQQNAVVSANALAGPRHVYETLRGPRWLVVFDLVTMLGYFIRFLGHTLRRTGNAGRDASSRRLLGIAWGLVRNDLRRERTDR